MNEELQITKTVGRNPTISQGEPNGDLVPAKADAKALRTEHVGKLLEGAYQEASKLKLKDGEWKKLREDFDDSLIEIRPHDGQIYLSHMILRERLWNVLGPNVAEICRERFMRVETNEINVDLVLLVRGAMVAEAIGTAKYFPNNANMNFGDCVEAAWSDALRRCCKKWGVGTQVWRPGYIRDWKEKHATEFKGKWQRISPKGVSVRPAAESDAMPVPGHSGAGKRATALPEDDYEPPF